MVYDFRLFTEVKTPLYRIVRHSVPL